MQARFSTPSSLAAHHRRLMASCAESGCPQVQQRSGAKPSARTVGESLCISKSVEAHYKGPDSERQGPTNRMSAAMFSGSPTVRAPRYLTDRAPSHIRSSRRSDRNANVQRDGAWDAWAQEEYSKADPKGGDESQRKLHESLVHNSQHATQRRHRQQNHSGIHQARRSVWPRRWVRQKGKLMRSSSVRASSSRSRACSMLTPEPPTPDPEIWTIERRR